MAKSLRKVADQLRAFALSLPEAYEDFPWGERVVKVKKKVFVFMGKGEDPALGFSVKLPSSGTGALDLPFAQPTGYGLGKAGWVSFTFERAADLPPSGVLLDWIAESYRAVAPKMLVKQLDATRSR